MLKNRLHLFIFLVFCLTFAACKQGQDCSGDGGNGGGYCGDAAKFGESPDGETAENASIPVERKGTVDTQIIENIFESESIEYLSTPSPHQVSLQWILKKNGELLILSKKSSLDPDVAVDHFPALILNEQDLFELEQKIQSYMTVLSEVEMSSEPCSGGRTEEVTFVRNGEVSKISVPHVYAPTKCDNMELKDDSPKIRLIKALRTLFQRAQYP